MWARFELDPESVEDSWRRFFEGMILGQELKREALARVPSIHDGSETSAEARVADLINAYRNFGHDSAQVDPLSEPSQVDASELLKIERFGFSESDLDKTFTAGGIVGLGPTTLRELRKHLKNVFCGSVGVELDHIHNSQERQWLLSRIENLELRKLDEESKKFILKRLTDSESFEHFLHTRYVAQKRFSLEGGESLIPALDCVMEYGAEFGVREFIFGMAHRGRLNVLVNILKKNPEYIFSEFEGNLQHDISMGEGDVKYHLGYFNPIKTRQGHSLYLSMVSNPSHLEFVNPVVEGVVRAKQDFQGDRARAQIVPILIHGDAAFAGQGICYETLNLSGLRGYATGGTIHFVINNQIGFTAIPQDSRSTPYPTDLAKMLEAPVFHVNADDPESVWWVSRLCVEYRQKFHKDVFLDLVCYRRHGHNEGDEPAFTQPVMVKKIKQHPTPRNLYIQKTGWKELSDELWKNAIEGWTQARERAKSQPEPPPIPSFEGRWKGLRRAEASDLLKSVETSVAKDRLLKCAERMNQVPDTFHLHPKLKRFFELRLQAVRTGEGIDWGNAEALAFATLLEEGVSVRLSGQDAERGTFSHRHSVLYDVETGVPFVPLCSLFSNVSQEFESGFQVYNSHLSESGVLGFDFGYSLADPRTLVIWEAQFGDFANGAQVIIDQFITSTESKWLRSSGIVLLLPHGFEGQGPEHSSARLERFLQLCGKSNISVCNCTTPAQFFHLLRRQMKRDFRKPLVVMTPKSLLRHPQVISKIDEFTQGRFLEALEENRGSGDWRNQIEKMILCSGKIYYELKAARDSQHLHSVALIRLEQLYPWPQELLSQILKQYPRLKKMIWLQEEPRNMGAWSYVSERWREEAPSVLPLGYFGRDYGAAPAVGSVKLHEKEQKTLIEGVLRV